MRFLTFTLLFGLSMLLACSNGEGTANTDNNATANTDDSSSTPPAPDTKYKLTPFTSSPAYEDAELKQMLYLDDSWKFDIGGSSYQLGVQTSDAPQKMCANSGKGQHIHLIVNDQPYRAKYTSNFSDVSLEDGEYHILSFLSRSYHESIKSGKAHLAQKFTVKDKTAVAFESINDPMIFYSRPKGVYAGKENTEKVMLDFFIINSELASDQYKVKVSINSEEDHILDKWQPYYIENLPIGKNTITLTLIDKNGDTVQAPYNPVTREFVLKETLE